MLHKTNLNFNEIIEYSTNIISSPELNKIKYKNG